ncbi:MAG TPA: 5-(carboxyamino)imidazole ribonucleotide synthase [Candidatus Limnocylindrales bacterium]|nr:5-(carboxyamino)imidazole ribonucleotide synthase [Candidatus Limnocylindrales bacterium]
MTHSATTTAKPIGPYERLAAEVHEWDPRTEIVARRVAELVAERRSDLTVEHIGSTAVPGLPGKGIVDLSIQTEPSDIPSVVALLYDLGFQPQPGPDPWPPTRPMPVGSYDLDGERFRIHLHVQPTGGDFPRDIAFRDALRNDPELTRQYTELKRAITKGGPVEGFRYTHSKTTWILGVYRQLGYVPPAILPPATIAILGGGQLGRMVGLAAREMGYRIAVLDPDPHCPAAAVADRVEVGTYADVEAAHRLVEGTDVVTYELEHVSAPLVGAIDDAKRPIRPGPYPLKITQDRLAERKFLEANGVPVAPWRPVASAEDVRAAVRELGFPVRLKASIGGYDGRSQWRLTSDADVETRVAALPFDSPMLVERELEFEAEVSVVVARAADGTMAVYPPARNVHDDGILVESTIPAGLPPAVDAAARELGELLATGMGLIGILTAELFLMPEGAMPDGSSGRLVVNELAPRVHNSGHWTIEGAVTSQFEQHVRAICGLPLGDTSMRASAAAMVNLLGEGSRRPANLAGVADALRAPDVHLHLYDKRDVFERRKMGHVTALGPDVETALAAARAARARLSWR